MVCHAAIRGRPTGKVNRGKALGRCKKLTQRHPAPKVAAATGKGIRMTASNASLPHVCIIGAGSSGITAGKVLKDHGVPFTIFEKGERIGGNWVFGNRNRMSSAYRSLHINTSRDKMAYSDFPMPADFPDFPHHAQIARYFEDYVDHFQFRDRIVFNCGVEHAARMDDGRWNITLETGEKKIFDFLIVANGHHWDPRWPEPPFPGTFDGAQIHSHHYIDPSDPVQCVGKNVVVVGFGNSALDIACELGRKGLAENVYISMRRGYWVIPKYIGGEALDAQVPHPSQDPPLWQRLIPASVMRKLAERRIVRVAGRPEDYGLPKPDHPFLATHPAVSQEIYIRVGSGDVLPKPNIKALKGNRVEFTDGSQVEADVIIYCTGYRISFPFFDPDFIAAPNNEIRLFKRMFDPRVPNLAFIALVQPLCAMMPIAEEQAKFVAKYITGQYHLPGREEMDAERNASFERMYGSYVKTPRHTIQINCGEYTYDLRRELRRGARRALKAGNTLPVPGAQQRQAAE
jgi:dimethylaniline monooxygenase (N-oxide forming)